MSAVARDDHGRSPSIVYEARCIGSEYGQSVFGMLQQGEKMPWKSFRNIYIRWMPRIILLNHWPRVRFDARYSRQEQYEVVPHVRICAGGCRVTGIPTATLASEHKVAHRT